MKPSHLLLAIVVMIVWGCSFVVAKNAIAEIPPMLFMAIRYVITAIVLLPFMWREKSRLGPVFGISVTLGFLHFAFGFTGLSGVDASVAVMLMQMQVPFAALLAVLVFKERVGWRRGLGMASAFVGVFLLVGEPRTASAPFSASLILIAAFLWGLSSIQVKRLGVMDTFALNGWIAAFAAPQMFVASLLFETGHIAAIKGAGIASFFGLAYLIIAVTIFGYGVWYHFLQRYPVNQALPLTLLTPVFGLLAGMLFLDEAAGWQRLLGAAIIIAGVAAILRQPATAARSLKP